MKRGGVSENFETSVFLNCPFDDAYRPMFRAAVFTIIVCGFVPRCALEVSDAAQVRIDKISAILGSCQLGLHDISRVELDPASNLPRFNMPLELGLFLGCKRFGSSRQKTKSCIVLDTEPYRYQKFISDISGQDVAAHHNDVRTLITRVRDWLAGYISGPPLLGGAAIADRYSAFVSKLPAICEKLQLQDANLTFTDLVFVVREFAASS